MYMCIYVYIYTLIMNLYEIYVTQLLFAFLNEEVVEFPQEY